MGNSYEKTIIFQVPCVSFRGGNITFPAAGTNNSRSSAHWWCWCNRVLESVETGGFFRKVVKIQRCGFGKRFFFGGLYISRLVEIMIQFAYMVYSFSLPIFHGSVENGVTYLKGNYTYTMGIIPFFTDPMTMWGRGIIWERSRNFWIQRVDDKQPHSGTVCLRTCCLRSWKIKPKRNVSILFCFF